MHSERTHAPTLNLIDCDFKYFFNLTSLIQVETNNFVELGLKYTYDADVALEPFNSLFQEFSTIEWERFQLDTEEDSVLLLTSAKMLVPRSERHGSEFGEIFSEGRLPRYS